MSGNTEKRRNRRVSLWEQNPHYVWCGRKMVLILRPPGMKDFPVFPNEATIDHLYSRLNDQRRHITDGTEVTVLSCWECNNKRGNAEQAALPIEELRRRCGAFPKA